MDSSDITEVADLVSEAQKLAGSSQPWWRGQAKDSWELVPKIFRRTTDPRVETNLIAEFVRRARTRHGKLPPAEDGSSWLYLAQHYGLPTRLLDWTESPLFALYFAVAEDAYLSEPGAVWATEPYRLNEQIVGERVLYNSGDAQSMRIIGKAFSSKEDSEEVVVALLAAETDLRMMVQMSCFTIHGSPTPMESREDLRPLLRKFVIPADCKPAIREQLRILGIRKRNLFPDLASLASDLSAAALG